jgi:AcrR family transcriptional regulator
MSGQRQGRRAYDSSGRRAQAEATRLRILDTARRLFVEHGYAGTSIAQIAAAAGVSVPTVFSAYRSKVNLLRTAAEATIVGDADPVPLHERPHMRHVHDGATAAEVLDRLADLNAATADRAYPIFAVVHAAADAEPDIAELVRVIDGQRLDGATMLARTVLDRLGDDDPDRLAEVRDSIWALNSLAMYGLLVAERGWTLDRYREWVRRALHAVVLP